MKVKSIDIKEAHKALKSCEKIVQDYVYALERSLERQKWITKKAKDQALKSDVIPALDLLQAWLEQRAYIAFQDGKWMLFQENGEFITGGETIRKMLINLIFIEC